MPRLRRKEPTNIPDDDTEAIELIIKAVKALLPPGRKVAVLRRVNKIIIDEIAAEEHKDSLVVADDDDESERGSVPLPRGMLGSRASMRGHLGHLHQQQGNQRKRILKNARGIPQPKQSTKNSRTVRHPAPKRLVVPSSSREYHDKVEESGTSSDGSEDSNVDDARTSRPAPRHTPVTPKQRKRGLSSHIARGRTVADPTVIHSPQTPVSSHPKIQNAKADSQLGGIIVQRDAQKRISYKCPKCPQIKQGRKVLEEHMMCHGARGKKCPDCDYATTSDSSYNWHLKVHLEPAQRKPRKKRGSRNKRRSPSPEIPPPRTTRSKADGHSGIPCVSHGGGDVSVSRRTLAKPVKREHPFSPGQSTSGKPRQRAKTEMQPPSEYKCTDCPEAFLFKPHLDLHRKHKHPAKNHRTDAQKRGLFSGKK